MRLAAQSKGGYYPTPDRVVDLIAELIHTPTGYYYRERETLRILDPCCGGGDALQRLAERLDRPEAHIHRDLRRRASPGPRRGGREAARPHPRGGPLQHLDSERGLRPAASQPAVRLGLGGQAGRARLPDAHDALPGRERPAGLHRPQAAPLLLGPLPVDPLRADAVLGLPGPRAGGLSTRWCCSATGRRTPCPTPRPRAW